MNHLFVTIGIFYVNNSNNYIFLEGREIAVMNMHDRKNLIDSYQATCNKLTYEGSMPGTFVVCVADYYDHAIFNITNNFTVNPAITGLITHEFTSQMIGV